MYESKNGLNLFLISLKPLEKGQTGKELRCYGEDKEKNGNSFKGVRVYENKAR